MPSENDVTRILQRTDRGEDGAAVALLPLVYDELHELARAHMQREPSDHTLQATALVHEAFLRLVNEKEVGWKGRGHFFGAAAVAMRRILVDHARRRRAAKRGGGAERVELTPTLEAPGSDEDVLAIDEALERLSARDPRKGRIVELFYFAGLDTHEVARCLEISTRTVQREWRYAKAWLHAEVRGSGA